MNHTKLFFLDGKGKKELMPHVSSMLYQVDYPDSPRGQLGCNRKAIDKNGSFRKGSIRHSAMSTLATHGHKCKEFLSLIPESDVGTTLKYSDSESAHGQVRRSKVAVAIAKVGRGETGHQLQSHATISD